MMLMIKGCDCVGVILL